MINSDILDQLFKRIGISNQQVIDNINDYILGKTDTFTPKPGASIADYFKSPNPNDNQSNKVNLLGYFASILSAKSLDSKDFDMQTAKRLSKVIASLYEGYPENDKESEEKGVAVIAITEGADIKESLLKSAESIRKLNKKHHDNEQVDFYFEVYFQLVCRAIFKLGPEKSKLYIEETLAKPIDTIISEMGTDITVFIQMLATAITSGIDSRYIPILAEICRKIDYMKSLAVLAWVIDKDAAFLAIFKELIDSNKKSAPILMAVTSRYKDIPYCRGNEGDMKSFMVNNDLPKYLYPIYILSKEYSQSNYPKACEFMSKLYDEDREIFYIIYDIYIMDSDHLANNIIVPLTAILLYNKDSKADIEVFNKKLLHIFKQVCEDTKETNLKDIRHYHSEAKLIYQFMPMYNYSDLVKKVVDRYIAEKSYASALSAYPLMMKVCFNIDPVESSEYLISKGVELEDIILAYLSMVESNMQPEKETIKTLTHKYAEKTATIFENEEFMDRLRNYYIDGITGVINLLYIDCAFDNIKPICKLLIADSSKKVQSDCIKILEPREKEARPTLEEALKKIRKHARKNIINSVLKKWDDATKYGDDFKFENSEQLIEFVKGNYDKILERNSRWIEDADISNVKFADLSVLVPPVVIRYITMEYLALKQPYRIRGVDKVVEALDKATLSETLENLYKKWLDEGADTKRKNIMIPYCIYGTEVQLISLRKQIDKWADNSRSTLCAYIVSAIAMNGKPFALMIVDSIANKFPKAMVKAAAQEAFGLAAKALNVPADMLGDKIVPNLGFSPDSTKILDFGNRTFTLRLMPSFNIEITDDEKGKTIKTLPNPSATDDIVKAESAKQEFSGLKKSLKSVVQMQESRLEKAIMNGRSWGIEDWKELFLDNPIMNAFAIKLIWGVYDGDRVTKSFRYMQDGTFNTSDEEVYTLPENAKVALIHPADISDEECSTWKQQLEDYEIKQPFPQMELKKYDISDNDIRNNSIIKYQGQKITLSTITFIAKKLNMQRGSIWDGGRFWEYFLEDDVAGIGVEMNFEGAHIGVGYDEEITFGSIIFYDLKKTGTLKDGYITVDQFCISDGIDPRKLPKRFTSCALSVFENYLNKQVNL